MRRVMSINNVHADLEKLASFAAGRLPVAEGEQQPVDRLLTQAWQALLDAEIIVDESGNPPVPGEYDKITVSVEDQYVTLGPKISPIGWRNENLPPLDGIVYSLAFALVAVLAGKSDAQEHPWPHQ